MARRLLLLLVVLMVLPGERQRPSDEEVDEQVEVKLCPFTIDYCKEQLIHKA